MYDKPAQQGCIPYPFHWMDVKEVPMLVLELVSSVLHARAVYTMTTCYVYANTHTR